MEDATALSLPLPPLPLWQTAGGAARQQRLDARQRAAAAFLSAPPWRRAAASIAAARAPIVAMALVVAVFLLKLTLVSNYGTALFDAARCRLRSADAAFWPPAFVDWRETTRFSDADERALDAFLTRNGTDTDTDPLLLGFAAAADIELARAWACAARAANLRPHIVALDGPATCMLLAADPGVPGRQALPCLAPAVHAGSVAAHAGHEHAALSARQAQRAATVSRVRLVWRVLARGRDLVLSDLDVVFAPNASLRLLDNVDARAELTTIAAAAPQLLAGMGGRLELFWRLAQRTGVPRLDFALVVVRASPRTVALWQLLHAQTALHGHDAATAYSVCVHAPWRALRLATLDRVRFAHDAGASASTGTRPVAVHVGRHGALGEAQGGLGVGANASLFNFMAAARQLGAPACLPE